MTFVRKAERLFKIMFFFLYESISIVPLKQCEIFIFLNSVGLYFQKRKLLLTLILLHCKKNSATNSGNLVNKSKIKC